jgi:hypothetical protein
MRSRALPLILSLLAGPLLSGQASAQHTRILKPIIGVNYATASGKDLTVHGAKAGINIGLMVEGRLPGRHFSLEGGLMYSHSSLDLSRAIRWQPYISPGDWRTREQVLMRFVKMPVAVLYRFKKPYSFFAGAGAALQFNITTTRGGNETSNQLLERPYFGRFAMNSTLGLPVGVAANIFVGREFNLGAAPGGLRLEYVLDATGWKYPTAGTYERDEPYTLRNSGLALNAWIRVGRDPSAKKQAVF